MNHIARSCGSRAAHFTMAECHLAHSCSASRTAAAMAASTRPKVTCRRSGRRTLYSPLSASAPQTACSTADLCGSATPRSPECSYTSSVLPPSAPPPSGQHPHALSSLGAAFTAAANACRSDPPWRCSASAALSLAANEHRVQCRPPHLICCAVAAVGLEDAGKLRSGRVSIFLLSRGSIFLLHTFTNRALRSGPETLSISPNKDPFFLQLAASRASQQRRVAAAVVHCQNAAPAQRFVL